MNTENTAPAMRDGHVPLTDKARIGWGIFIAQLVTIVVVYLVGSTLPAVPAIIEHIQSGKTGEPELSSFVVAISVIVGMIAALIVAWAWLRSEGRVREAIRLDAPTNWVSTLAWAALGLGGTIAIFALGGQLVEALGLGSPDPTFVLDLVTESPALFWLWIFGVAIFAAGFGEEVLWRGFLMDRLERLPGLNGRVWLVLIVQAVIFGLPHSYQGAGGMVVTGMVGLFFGWIRLKNAGNLWAVIIAHATVDVLMMSLAYADKLGWFVE